MTAKPLVYVAGPITGNPWGCVRQATTAFGLIRSAGCTPFLPQLSVLHEMVDPLPYEDWMSYDLDVIARCDALVRLDGDSDGADREVLAASELGLHIVHWPANPELDPTTPTILADLASWAAAWTPPPRAHTRV